jgi:hypothetical protein
LLEKIKKTTNFLPNTLFPQKILPFATSLEEILQSQAVDDLTTYYGAKKEIGICMPGNYGKNRNLPS